MASYQYASWSSLMVVLVVKVCQAFEYCVEESTYSFSEKYIYCEYSCCGYKYNRYCCENYSGVIAGAVVGSVIFLGIIVGVILCFIKKKGHRGVVIAPSAHTTQTTVSFVTSTQIQPQYSNPPPAYGVAPAYQPTYSYQPLPTYVAAYPPPPAYSHDNMYHTNPHDVGTLHQRDSSVYPPTAPFLSTS